MKIKGHEQVSLFSNLVTHIRATEYKPHVPLLPRCFFSVLYMHNIILYLLASSVPNYSSFWLFLTEHFGFVLSQISVTSTKFIEKTLTSRILDEFH